MIYAQEPERIGSKLIGRVGASSMDELKEFADSLGLQPEWIHNDPFPHFKVYGSKLQIALTNPNVQYLTVKEFIALMSAFNFFDEVTRDVTGS